MSGESSYVVRGAKMKCKSGSHHRKINLPVSHGSYVGEKPMMNEEDNKEDNISYFGICKGGSDSEEILDLIEEEGGGTITGKKCRPKILEKWTETKEVTLVEGKPALTTDSKLICAFGGIIEFKSSGQEED